MLRIFGPGLLALLVLLFGSPALAQPTTTTLTTSINPSEPHTELDLTASVTPDNGGPASGSVEFFDGSTSLGTASLQSGTGQTTLEDVRPLTAGVHSLTAVYTSDSTFTGSSSAPYSQTVNAIPPDASVSSSTSGSPSMAGDDVTFTALVDAPSSVGSSVPDPTGTVTFSIDDVDVGTVPFDGFGAATYTTSQLAVGSHTVKATYNGDSYYAAATTVPLTQAVKGSTTTAVGCGCSIPQASGQTISIDATIAVVAPGTGTPTGTVEFFVNGASVGTAAVVEELPGFFMAAILTPALSAIGDYEVTATYSGDANFAGSAGNTVEVPVIEAVPLTMTSSPSLSTVFGETVTFTVTVGGGAPLVGHMVYFTSDTGINLGSIGLAGTGGVVHLPTSTLPVGTHIITAHYDGDGAGGFPFTTISLTHVVNQATTTTTLASDINPSGLGHEVEFTATVGVDAPGGGAPTGTVSFYDGATLLDSSPLTAGEATFATAALTLGPHSITAVYNGDASFTGSTSSALTQTVDAAETTTTTLSVTPNPSLAGQSATFTAMVSGGTSTPTGTVTFNVDGTDVVPNVSLTAGGEASLATSTLTAGSHTVIATYNGDGTHLTSSDTETQVVQFIATTTTLTSSQNPSNLGQPVTFTATVTGAGGLPTGTVKFLAGGVQVGVVPLNASGIVTFTTSGLGVGSHEIEAEYSGDAAFGPSTSNAVTQVVNALGTIALVVTTDGSDASFGFTSVTSSLNLTVVTAGGTGSSGGVALAASTYSISAQPMAAAGFALSSITCDDNNSAGDASAGTATVLLDAGENVVCTFAFIDSRSAATELIEDFFDTRAELILSHGPNSQRRIDRLNGIAPSVGNPASALMGLMPMVSGGGPRALSGSLGAIEQAMADPAEPAAFDIWFETTFGAYGSDAAQGNFGIAYLGADYLVSSDLLVGALFQLDRVGFDSNTGDATAEGTGWMIGPYVTGRLGDNLYVDLRAAAGRSANSISPYGTYTDEVDASRWLIEAAVTGEWTDGTWTFQPTARLSYFEETSDGYTDGLGVYVPSVTSGTGQVALGPALSYRFVTDGEIDVVLGAALDGVLDFSLDGGALVSDGAHAELEASIDLALPGGARIGASVKAGGLGEDDFHFLSGTVSVSAAIQ